MLPLLCEYDAKLVSLLSNGFKFGFPLHFEGPRKSFQASNLLSAIQNPEIVSAKILQELKAKRLAGPFETNPFPNFRVSPLDVLYQRRLLGEYRLIHHFHFLAVIQSTMVLLGSTRTFPMLVSMIQFE